MFVLYCDKCGEQKDKETGYFSYENKDFYEIIIAQMNETPQVEKLHLCSDCLSDFKAWMNRG